MNTTHTPPTSARYQGSPAEIYQRYFVPSIGSPVAAPLIGAAGLRRGQRVLDVACGTGVATRLAARSVGPEGMVAGIDGNRGMLDVARSSTPSELGIDWREASADGLPFGDDSFDAALCSISLQFFADKLGALGEMRRVVAPGGRVAIGVPGPMPAAFQELAGVLEAHVGADAAAFVHVVFSIDEESQLHDLMAAGGLADIDCDRHTVPVHLGAPADFFWQYALGTPLAQPIGRLGADEQVDLEHAMVDRWERLTGVDGLDLDVELIVGTATTP